MQNGVKVERFSGEVKAVVFDAFGTLVQIRKQHRPYLHLLKRLRAAGRVPLPSDAVQIMLNDVDLAGALQMFNWDLPSSSIAELEAALQSELSTIQLYSDVLATLVSLRSNGLKIGICSNLAAPYAPAVKKLMPFELDAYAWSFEVGAVKPQKEIYQHVCALLRCQPSEVVMIGDTLEADCVAPNKYGMRGFHLTRDGKKSSEHCLTGIDEILMVLGIDAAEG
jgi:HAD superfamily hydrolase (TIGR01549 family)